MKTSLLTAAIISLVIFSVSAQNKVSGILIDKKLNTPVPYATVYINGTSNGTISNIEGQFNLAITTFPCKLIISHVGYQRIVLDIYEACTQKHYI